MAGEVIEFDLKTPLNETTIREHIAHANGLGLSSSLGADATLTVIAGGPSARDAPQDGTVLALNGAIRLCPSAKFFAACDPQALVADFLRLPPRGTQYHIASKCHPDVFKTLQHRDVRLWHVADYVPGGIPTAPSITLTALNLFFRMGWRRFEVYGWDGHFLNGLDHASPQPFKADLIDIEVGERLFHTTTTWAAEAQDAAYLLPIYEFLGAEITIHGDSMIKAIRDHRSAAA